VRSSFPPEFDAGYYRARYPELALASDFEAEAHFRDYGIAAGLEGSPLALREEFLKQVVGRAEGEALEIGPSWAPILRGSHASYLDIFDAGELRSRATKNGADPDSCPEVIDYVGDIANVDRQFDYVVSSHAIEHQPDLVHHLASVAKLLKPGGRYFLIIPDKRFCFDALKPESTIAGVLQAHRERRSHHSLQSVIEGAAFSTHNDAAVHWQTPPEPLDDEELANRVEAALKEFDAAEGDYLDVHAWYFTPSSFRAIASTLFKLGLTDLEPVRVFNTPRNRLEFCAIVEKSEKQEDRVVEDYWDEQVEAAKEMPPNSAWWNSPIVIRHINKIACGEPLDRVHAGFHKRIDEMLAGTPRPRKALSVGCGVGTKEMDLLALGSIDMFECYEVSGDAAASGNSIARERGLGSSFVIHHADAFAADLPDDFDLVYWNNSLHHMMDTREAVRWSRDRLKPGGLFAIDDYVGATRNQHSQALVDWGSKLMASLPDHLRKHWNGKDIMPPFVGRVDPQELEKIDPSECADSASILPAIYEFFPDPQVIKTGGAAYFVALMHTFHNFVSESEVQLLENILKSDAEAPDEVETQYAIVLAKKA